MTASPAQQVSAALDATMGASQADPFISTPTSAGQRPNSHIMSDYARGSPSQAKRALEEHIADTDRRIRNTSQLGTTLLEQKQQLVERLIEVEEHAEEEDLAPELRQKLVDLEKEYNEVGRDAARISLHKGKRTSRDFSQELNSLAREGSEMSATGRTSPTKLSIPSASTSRKARHSHSGSSAQVKDLELATEISTSLLTEVRSLQAQLVDKDDALKRAQKESSEIHTHTETLANRLRGVDDNEQRYKDENWNLETQVQDLSNHIKEISTREEKLMHALNVAKSEKSTADREYEELRQSHGKLAEDHSTLKRQLDLEQASSRRNITDVESEREKMQRQVEELTNQNQELAKAIAYRVKHENGPRDAEESTRADLDGEELGTPEGSPPPSPSKFATPRHGGLESETLKSSLAHAHRMIQNLKNNIHREKTEKVELKRLLEKTQDDLEARHNDGSTAANAGRKRQPPRGQEVNKRSANPAKLGLAKGASEEIFEDPSWEEYSETPIRKSIEKDDAHGFSTDGSDAFETADERNTTDDTDAFETGAESIAGDSDDDLTETEGETRTPSGTVRNPPRRHRDSYTSTASDEDQFDIATPPASLPRYKLKLNNRGLSRSVTPGNRPSPAPSFMSNQGGQNLAAELEDLDNSSLASSTPARSVVSSRFGKTPEPSEISRRDTVIRSPSVPALPAMVDSGMMTEPTKTDSDPQPQPEGHLTETSITAAAGAAVGAALSTVFGDSSSAAPQTAPEKTVERTADGSQETMSLPEAKPAQVLSISGIKSQSTKPITPKLPAPSSPRKTETPRSPLAAVSPNMPLRPAPTKPDARDSSFPPPSVLKQDSLSPASQAWLNDLLNKAHNRSKSQPSARSTPATPERSGKMANVATPSNSAPRRKTVTDGETDRLNGRPSFAISIEGREVQAGDATPPAVGRRTNSMTSSPRNRVSPRSNEDVIEPALRVQSPALINDGSFREPTLQFGSPLDEVFQPPQPIPSSKTTLPVAAARQELASNTRSPITGMIESGTQTSVSGEQIDNLVKSSHKSLPSSAMGTATTSTGSPRSIKGASGRAMSLGATTDTNFLKSLKSRPIVGSGARRPVSPPPSVPPLPVDHREVIAAAAASRSSSLLSMPTPNMPSSALKVHQQPQQAPRTPTSATNQITAKSATPRNRTSSIARSEMSRRSSVSSFASELDVRFNMAPQNRSSQNLVADGYDAGSATDPRMIQAITQTMIGETLWKYVRKTGRGEMSDNRHRRFFWIHPYTKTLYWSSADPSLAKRGETKAKSVQIEAVRVVTDENPHPPGLHLKSIVIVTPGRSIKFTAPTSARHETWFNALSYLLLRAVPDDGTGAGGNGGDVMNSARNYSNVSGLNERSNTLNSITAEDMADFTPQGMYNRNSSRVSHRSSNTHRSSTYITPTLNASVSSLNSPYRRSTQGLNSSNLAVRQSQASAKRQSQMSSGSDMSPLRSHPIAPIAPIEESLDSQRNSLGHDRPVTASSAGTNANATAGDVDADGFRKPALPAGRLSKPGTRTQLPESPTGKGEGRLASLTSKLRRKSRAKSTSEAAQGVNPTHEAPPPMPNQVYPESGRLENVRACCDGKHDVGDLHGHHHHHGGSRHNSFASRTWSLGSRTSRH